MSAVLAETSHLATCEHTHVQLRSNVRIPELGIPDVTYAVYHLEIGPRYTMFGKQPSPDQTHCVAQRLLPGLYMCPLGQVDNYPHVLRIHLLALHRQDYRPIGDRSALRWLEQTIPWRFNPLALFIDAEQRNQAHDEHWSAIHGLRGVSRVLMSSMDELQHAAFRGTGSYQQDTLPIELFRFHGDQLAGACAAE